MKISSCKSTNYFYTKNIFNELISTFFYDPILRVTPLFINTWILWKNQCKKLPFVPFRQRSKPFGRIYVPLNRDVFIFEKNVASY